MQLGAPTTLFDVTAGGTTLAKTLYTATLPTPPRSTTPYPANITQTAVVVGGVTGVHPSWTSLLFDFLSVGAADLTLTVEIGKVQVQNGFAIPLASVALKSITTSGTVADANPYTGATTTGVTWRLFDLATITSLAASGVVAANVGGSEDQQPVQLVVNVAGAQWIYALVTNISTLTRAACVVTPR